MKKKLLVVFLIVVAILFSSSTGCKKNSSTPTEPIDTTGGGAVVRKPNIYIYPQVKSVVSVKLEFPLGGIVIESIPAYLGEWSVQAEPTGKIDNKYDYLFYEAKTPDIYQYSSGWIVNRDSLPLFFRTKLSESGFIDREINDFTQYWIQRLITYPYYFIYPQFSNDIDKIIRLKISPSPDNVLRLFFIIKGSEKNVIDLSKPIVPKFAREGFVVAEWGVVLK
ncbi:MAG: hypothetical protein NTX22_09160 [Ignavibacteriales bacterium]|nr:hypothetical protein [Ignavibacteriales bacterium]